MPGCIMPGCIMPGCIMPGCIMPIIDGSIPTGAIAGMPPGPIAGPPIIDAAPIGAAIAPPPIEICCVRICTVWSIWSCCWSAAIWFCTIWTCSAIARSVGAGCGGPIIWAIAIGSMPACAFGSCCSSGGGPSAARFITQTLERSRAVASFRTASASAIEAS